MFGWFRHFGQKRHEPIAYLMINMYIGKVSESMKTCHKMEILDVASTLPTHRALWENFVVYLQGHFIYMNIHPRKEEEYNAYSLKVGEILMPIYRCKICPTLKV
jgi:hypothetical protein